MGARYAGIADNVATGTNLTILTLISATTVRPSLYELILGSDATPADVATDFHLERFTAAGTEGSGYTPLPLDADDVAALGDYGVGVFGGEPTYTASEVLMSLTLNQRATFRWVAAPGAGLQCPATAANGIGLQSQGSGGTPAYNATMYHEE